MSSESLRKQLERKQIELTKKIKELRECSEKIKLVDQNERTRKSFERLVEETTAIGEELAHPRNERSTDGRTLRAKDETLPWAHITLLGCLEGDFVEKFSPLTLTGGVFVRSPHGNVLIDCSSGTRNGLREMGVDVRDIDAIFVSHYHQSVRNDLHVLLSEIGAFPLKRAPKSPEEREKQDHLKKHFFSTEAVISGRSDNPALILPMYESVIKPHSTSFGSKANQSLTGSGCDPEGKAPVLSYRMRKRGLHCEVEGPGSFEHPDDESLLIRLFPAYHHEVAGRGTTTDPEGLSGKWVSSCFLQSRGVGIYVSGDTEFTPALEESLKCIAGGAVHVAILNMKTLEYRPKEKRKEGASWHSLALTRNQLGFSGVRRIVHLLAPKIVVLKSLGLECLISKYEGKIVFTPEKITQLKAALALALREEGYLADLKIVIPARHEILVEAVATGTKVTDRERVPSAPPSEAVTIGGQFVTGNPDLIHAIYYFLGVLQKERQPYLVIMGESGIGKTLLARAMAYHLYMQAHPDAPLNLRAMRGAVLTQDLATVNHSDSNHGNQIFGWPAGSYWREDTGHPGLLAGPHDTLILNQLEKLPIDASKKYLDALENWRFLRFKATDETDVTVKLIFTTNVPIEALPNLTDDLKGRLRGRCLTIPGIDERGEEARRQELSLIINFWCRTQNVHISIKGWDILLDLDLRTGSLRTLRKVLEAARGLAMATMCVIPSKDAQAPDIAVYLETDDILAAMAIVEVARRRH